VLDPRIKEGETEQLSCNRLCRLHMTGALGPCRSVGGKQAAHSAWRFRTKLHTALNSVEKEGSPERPRVSSSNGWRYHHILQNRPPDDQERLGKQRQISRLWFFGTKKRGSEAHIGPNWRLYPAIFAICKNPRLPEEELWGKKNNA